MSDPVKVRILDREFMVAAPPEERDSLLESARHLDERMRDIRDAGKIVGMDRIAVMAALNLCHDLLESRRATQAAEGLEERLQRLDRQIADYLDDVDAAAELKR